MRTWPALMDEVGAALQFGDYVGENLPALDECLSVDWLPTAVGYVLVVVQPEEVLVEEAESADRPNHELTNLVEVLATAADLRRGAARCRGAPRPGRVPLATGRRTSLTSAEVFHRSASGGSPDARPPRRS